MSGDYAVLPHDAAAEAAVLSAILAEPNALDLVVTSLSTGDFYYDPNRLIYEAMLAMTAEAKPIDVLTVAAKLRAEGGWEKVGVAHMNQIADAVPYVANVEAYARTVRDLARVRAAIGTCQRAAAEGYGEIGEAQAWLEGVASAVAQIALVGDVETMVSVKTAIENTLAGHFQGQPNAGIRRRGTGLLALDRLCKLVDGALHILAARPGKGKSSLAVNTTACQVAAGREGVAVFSLEMQTTELMLRLLAAEAGVPLVALSENKLTPKQWAAITPAAQQIASWNLWVDDRPSLTLVQIRAKAKKCARLCAERGTRLGLVVIDYLQLMGESGKPRSREEAIAANSRGLKALAKELSCPVLCLSQMNRAVESRKGGKPVLSDLRESGAIEQDADSVWFIHDTADAHPAEERDVELIVAKNRNGATGSAVVRWQPTITRFADAPDYAAQGASR